MFRTTVQNDRRPAPARYDVVVLGGGLAGMATTSRLQVAGLVDFEPGGVGAELLDTVGPVHWRARAWPGTGPGRVPGLAARSDDHPAPRPGRPAKGAARPSRRHPAHHRFWALLDRLADTFWNAGRSGARMPVRGLRDDRALVALLGMLGMLVEDTVHACVDDAPLINAALGVTIRGAGLTRHRGGMRGFWQVLVRHYRELGGQLFVGRQALSVTGQLGAFRILTSRGVLDAGQVVSFLPTATAATTAEITHVGKVSERLGRYVNGDRDGLGGAFVAFLGVPENEVAGQAFTPASCCRTPAPAG